MSLVHHRIRVNEDLLHPDRIKKTAPPFVFSKYLKGKVNDTLPNGKVEGVYFIPYKYINTPTPNIPLNTGGEGQGFQKPTISVDRWEHTNIRIVDAQGRLVIENESDIQDFQHKAGGYDRGVKTMEFTSDNDNIAIHWETFGQEPICGEFIFIIKQTDCGC